MLRESEETCQAQLNGKTTDSCRMSLPQVRNSLGSGLQHITLRRGRTSRRRCPRLLLDRYDRVLCLCPVHHRPPQAAHPNVVAGHEAKMISRNINIIPAADLNNSLCTGGVLMNDQIASYRKAALAQSKSGHVDSLAILRLSGSHDSVVLNSQVVNRSPCAGVRTYACKCAHSRNTLELRRQDSITADGAVHAAVADDPVVVIAHPNVIAGDGNDGWVCAIHPCNPDCRAGRGSLSAGRRLKTQTIGVARATAIKCRGTEFRGPAPVTISLLIMLTGPQSCPLICISILMPFPLPQWVFRRRILLSFTVRFAPPFLKNIASWGALKTVIFATVLSTSPEKCQKDTAWHRCDCGAVGLEIMQMNIQDPRSYRGDSRLLPALRQLED